MSDIKSGYYPYKEFRYDQDQDAYELMSRWTSADTVYLQDGENVSDTMKNLNQQVAGIIVDSATSNNSTWSSTKLSGELSDLSTEVNKKAEVKYKTLYPQGTASLDPSDTNTYDSYWEVDMFEGFFSVSRNTTKVVGIIDRWGEAITYITPEDTSFVTIWIGTYGGKKKVVFQNESSVNILVMYIDDGHFNL